MSYYDKVFISESPSESHIELIKGIFNTIDLETHLSDSFIYIEIEDGGGIEIVSVKDEFVISTSKELNIDNKMSIQYLKSKHQIDQSFNRLLYWSGLNEMKKYIPVLKDDDDGEKVYADKNIYAKNVLDAINELNDIDFTNYLYLEDVDEEI